MCGEEKEAEEPVRKLKTILLVTSHLPVTVRRTLPTDNTVTVSSWLFSGFKSIADYCGDWGGGAKEREPENSLLSKYLHPERVYTFDAVF